MIVPGHRHKPILSIIWICLLVQMTEIAFFVILLIFEIATKNNCFGDLHGVGCIIDNYLINSRLDRLKTHCWLSFHLADCFWYRPSDRCWCWLHLPPPPDHPVPSPPLLPPPLHLHRWWPRLSHPGRPPGLRGHAKMGGVGYVQLLKTTRPKRYENDKTKMHVKILELEGPLW